MNQFAMTDSKRNNLQMQSKENPSPGLQLTPSPFKKQSMDSKYAKRRLDKTKDTTADHGLNQSMIISTKQDLRLLNTKADESSSHKASARSVSCPQSPIPFSANESELA
jgi:hypothetical protein